MTERNTSTRIIPDSTERYGSKLNRRLQNRQSSQKLRNNNKSQLDELAEKVKFLADDNKQLKLENSELKDQNVYLVKKCAFYERTLKASLQQNEESDDSDDLKIVCDPKEEQYYRIGGSQDKQKFARNFLCLTIFTVLLQIIDIDVQLGNNGNGSSPMALKSVDIGRMSQDFMTKMMSALPTTIFFAKNLLLIVWVVVLVVNYKKIVR